MAGLSKAARDLGDLRRAAMGAAREVREFDAALRALRRRLLRAMQLEARTIAKMFAARYERLGLYANTSGALQKVKPYGDKWGKRKKRLGLDSRRGIARKGVLKTLKSPRIITKTARGFVFDPKIPDITITGRATVGKSLRALAGKRIIGKIDGKRAVVGIGIKHQVTNRRSFRVNNYIDHFADLKARGLGSLARVDFDRMRKARHAEYDKWVSELSASARRRLAGRDLLRIMFRLKKLRG
ncbi:MAG: hypothetical protein M5U25_01955 [Planctomycetota bacterium]|nr:hypothetical protein [Planctomycetota bacterium]